MSHDHSIQELPNEVNTKKEARKPLFRCHFTLSSSPLRDPPEPDPTQPPVQPGEHAREQIPVSVDRQKDPDDEQDGQDSVRRGQRGRQLS